MAIMKTLTLNGETYNMTPLVPVAQVTLLASAWIGDVTPYSQTVVPIFAFLFLES